MSLRIARGLELPDDFVTQPCAIMARRGAGKTYTASVLTEELLGAGLPVVCLDPLGVWWGLRSSADGEHEGLPVTILGGAHGDVPLESTGGKVIAELVTEQPGGYVIDLSHFESNAAQDRFACDFAERLYRAMARQDATPLHLMVDEAHNFVPQNVQSGRGSGGIGPKMLGAFEALIRQGRSRGIGCTLISQRPAVVNKNVLSQVEVLIAGQVTGAIDRDALTSWAKGWAGKDQLAEFTDSLASLKVGEAWVWSPQWLEVFQRVNVRKRRTFDSSATPKAGERRIEPRVLASVDLEVVKERLAATIERAKADDPAELRKQVAALNRELREARKAIQTVEVRVEVPTIPAGLRRFVERAHAALDEIPAEPEVRTPQPAPVVRDLPPPRSVPGPSGDTSGIVAGARRMLQALATFPGGLTRPQVGTLAKVKHTSGTFSSYLGRLRNAGLVTDDGGLLRITDAGLDMVGGALPADPESLRNEWRQRLTGGARRMYDLCIERYPEWWDRQQIAEAAELASNSGTFSAYLGRLRTNGLIEESGHDLRAHPVLFMERYG